VGALGARGGDEGEEFVCGWLKRARGGETRRGNG